MTTGFGELRTRWAPATNTRILVASILAAIAIGLFLVFVVFRAHAGPLFTHPLTGDQVQEVDAKLAEWGVAHTTSPDNVNVAPDRRDTTLLHLALAGVPHSAIVGSSETIAKLQPLSPPAVIDAQALSGLEGDLEIALRSIDGVRDARVIVAPAQRAFFADEQPRAASASVQIALVPGASLADQTVAGIRDFVANAVAGLSADRVAVIDDRGVALGGARNAGNASKLEQTIQAALDRSFGAGRTIVLLHTDVDSSRKSTREVNRSPATNSVASKTLTEKYHGRDKNYSKSESSVDAGSIAIEKDVDSPAGDVSRMSAAVMVDPSLMPQAGSIRSIVEAAAGLQRSRGDFVEIAAAPMLAAIAPVPLTHATRPPPAVEPNRSTALLSLAALMAVGGLGLIFAPLVSRFMAFSRTVPRTGAASSPSVSTVCTDPADDVERLDLEALRRRLAGEPPHVVAAIVSRLPAPTALAVLERYEALERAEIVKRCGRGVPMLVQDVRL